MGMLPAHFEQIRVLGHLSKGMGLVSEWSDPLVREAVMVAISEQIAAVSDGLSYVGEVAGRVADSESN